ncbi:MAG: hypothetical protein JSR82_17180 [Verrucomicrobia bacterium]|nr:hypothetical protein [Verrucomicrobiota bacterium]
MTPTAAPETPTESPAVPTPPTPEVAAASAPGYFNAAQIEAVEQARSLQAYCEGKPELQEALAKEEIDAEILANFAALVTEATERLVQTAARHDDKRSDTTTAGRARTALLKLLKNVQSAAKQRSRLARAKGLAFSLDGYLLGQNLAISRALLLANAEALRLKAQQDGLPGYTAEKLQAIATARAAFADTKDEQEEGVAVASLATVDRNTLVARLQDVRMAILHACDRLFPHETPANVPTRRLLGLPPQRRLKD